MSKRKPWFCQDCRIIMTYDGKQDFYKCPECGIEVWPLKQVVNDEIGSLMYDMAHTHKPREIMPAGPLMPGSGSRNRSRKKNMKKDTLATLNQKLYKEC